MERGGTGWRGEQGGMDFPRLFLAGIHLEFRSEFKPSASGWRLDGGVSFTSQRRDGKRRAEIPFHINQLSSPRRRGPQDEKVPRPISRSLKQGAL